MKPVMRTFLLIVASVLALAAFSISAQAAEQKQAQNPEQWRYTFHNGQWWYWLPQSRWVYWQNDRWNDYSPPASRGAARMPCVLSSFDGTAGPSTDGRAQSGVAVSAEQTRPSPTYNDQTTASQVGPFYGHSGSAIGYPALSTNSSTGPFYGKADSDIRYPATSVNSEVGPFYGKATSTPESTVDMGHFPGY
jgi:opacity protein-like surface antigen